MVDIASYVPLKSGRYRLLNPNDSITLMTPHCDSFDTCVSGRKIANVLSLFLIRRIFNLFLSPIRPGRWCMSVAIHLHSEQLSFEAVQVKGSEVTLRGQVRT